MRFPSRVFALAILPFALALAAAPAGAQTFGPAYVYSGLAWDFDSTTSGFSGCTTLRLDAAGNFTNSDDYVVYGRLYCPSLGGYYSSSGNAYFDSFGKFNLRIDLGVTDKLVCTGLSATTMTGACTIYTNNGATAGSAFISFL
jgi:hypothetical protein